MTTSQQPVGARRQREWKTVLVMLEMYCRAHHPTPHGLCPECDALRDYAYRRLCRCVFGDAKPTCAKCVVHCYSKIMQERIKQVMRYSGPRMLFKHPYLAVRHLLDGRRAWVCEGLPPKHRPPGN